MSLCVRIIPCLDMKGGRVVKGVRFGALRDVGDPVELAARYAQEGADEIVVLDVTATLEERGHRLDLLRRLRRVLDVPLTIGGGIASVDDALQVLAAGADKVAINSAALATPALIDSMAERFGAQCTVVAIDVSRQSQGFAVLSRAATCDSGRELGAWAAEVEARGAGELLLTSFDRDGTGQGFDLEAIAVARAHTTLPIIASGGAKDEGDLAPAITAGADAVLAAGMFHSGRVTIDSARRALIQAGLELRT